MSDRNARSSYNRGEYRRRNGYGECGSFNNNISKSKGQANDKKNVKENKKETSVFFKNN